MSFDQLNCMKNVRTEARSILKRFFGNGFVKISTFCSLIYVSPFYLFPALLDSHEEKLDVNWFNSFMVFLVLDNTLCKFAVTVDGNGACGSP